MIGYERIDPSRIPAGMGLEGHFAVKHPMVRARQATRIKPGETFRAKLTWPGDQKTIKVYAVGFDRKSMNGRQRKIFDKILKRISRNRIRERRRDEHCGVMRFVI